MNKPELIDNCTYKLGRLDRKTVEAAFESILELMAQSLEKGERIEIRGFGSFTLRIKKACMQRNPKSGEKFMGRAKHYPHFKPGKELKDRVNATME